MTRGRESDEDITIFDSTGLVILDIICAKLTYEKDKERMEEILATHKPDPLTPKQENDVARILGEAWQYYRKKDML